MQHRVAAVGGDGIGPEIVAAGKDVLDAAGERYGSRSLGRSLISGRRYLATCELLTEDDIRELSEFSSIFFGRSATTG
jgi:3-isopropylmalate dehydrogenase